MGFDCLQAVRIDNSILQKLPENYDYIKTENRNKLLQSLRNVEVAKVLRNKIEQSKPNESSLQLEKRWDQAKDKVKKEIQLFETVKKKRMSRKNKNIFFNSRKSTARKKV